MTRSRLARRLLLAMGALSLVALVTSAAAAKESGRKRATKGRVRPQSAAQIAGPKTSSSGPSQEALARALARRAMDGALASGDATEARRLLEQARMLCAEDHCSAAMVAALHRDIAVCASAEGASDDEITATLREGFRHDPQMTLEAHRRTEKLARLYAQAKRAELGISAAEPRSETSADPAPAASTSASAPAAPTPPEERLRRFWIGVEGSLDIAFLASANDVCRLEGTRPVSAGFFCTHSDGTDYPNAVENDALRPGELDSVAGGPTLGNIRVKLRVDLALDEHWLVGGRFGYVTRNYPGSAASGVGVGVPFELEARVTYLHGRRPLTGAETSQYVYLGAGVSETSAGVRVEIVERSGQVRSVDAWQIGGAVYMSAGLGVRYALTSSIGILAGPRFALAIGGDRLLPVLAPEIAVHFGF